jgi:hypothetical protein
MDKEIREKRKQGKKEKPSFYGVLREFDKDND